MLVDNHRRFLAFLEKRVGSRDDAEEILQAAYVKSVERADTIAEPERSVAWFYRLLRNAVVDHYRHNASARRAAERERNYAHSADDVVDTELQNVVCECVATLASTLKSDYQQVLTAIDIEDQDIAEYAATNQLTANNVRVRLHRARRALLERLQTSCGTCAEHGCLDCTCSRQ